MGWLIASRLDENFLNSDKFSAFFDEFCQNLKIFIWNALQKYENGQQKERKEWHKQCQCNAREVTKQEEK